MEKSEPSKDNKHILYLGKNHNTRTQINSLGDIEFKYVSYGDTKNFAEILQEKLSDRDFVVKILFHQLMKPKIDLMVFRKLSDEELEKLARIFVKNEKHTFEYIKNGDNYFKDFKQALATKNEKDIQEFRKAFEPMIKSVQKTFATFNKNYVSVTQQALDSSLYIQKSIQDLTKLTKQINDMQCNLFDSMKPAIKQYQLNAKVIAESLRPQFDLWQKWTEQNKSIFENFRNLAIDQKKKEFLLQNGWIFSPYLSHKAIEGELNSDSILKKKNSEINTIYENFFSKNNYQEIENMINSWSNNKFFGNRIEIFTDCLTILRVFRINKKNIKINPARMILPLLIAQIDGITSEYAKDKGLMIDQTQWKDASGKIVNKFDSIWSQPCDNDSEIFTIRMLEEYLFGKAYPYGQKNPNKNNETPQKVKLRPFFQFNRHKIMHGEDLNFGTIDNVLRAFLLLDFLANLK